MLRQGMRSHIFALGKTLPEPMTDLYSCALYRNGEVGSKKRMANTNPIPTSRLNLFKKKKGAIDSFVKPRDDFDFPASGVAAAPQLYSFSYPKP